MKRKIKMRRKVSVNYKEHTWGDLTDRADVTSCHAPLRPHRFAPLYHTPLCTTLLYHTPLYHTPLCTTPLYHTPRFNSALLRYTPLRTALLRSTLLCITETLAAEAGKSLYAKDPQLLLPPTHGWRTFGLANSCTMEIWRRNMCHLE